MVHVAVGVHEASTHTLVYTSLLQARAYVFMYVHFVRPQLCRTG